MDTAFLILIGLAALVIGGDLLVRGAVELARLIGLSPLVIGLTLVGFGTSTPELVTSIQAAFAGSPGIAVGNVVGSNIANTLLILGFAAVLAPLAIDKIAFRRDGIVLLISTLMCFAAIQYGQLSPLIGAIFIAALLSYVIYTVVQERSSQTATPSPAISDQESPPQGKLWINILFVIAGLTMTIFGAKFLVSGAINIASNFGVSEAVIGLTIVAVGTSLPELVTTIAAAKRGQSDIAFGNIVGSNIFNILFILGSTALIKPIQVPKTIASIDIYVMLAVTILLLIIAVTRWRITRIEGAVLLSTYILYSLWLGLEAAS